MFGTLGGPELLLILVIALIVFGPKKLPEIGKSVGKMMVEFRRASNDFKRTIEEEVEADKMRSALSETSAEVSKVAAEANPLEAASRTAQAPEPTAAEAALSRIHEPAAADAAGAAPAAEPPAGTVAQAAAPAPQTEPK